jgi:hypothetical protein
MSDVMELVIVEMEVSEISEKELETTFQRVVAAHRDAVRSIQDSMQDADDAYRKYLDPNYIPLEAEAKKDRAALNHAEKNVADQYAALKKAYEKPLVGIETNIKQIRDAIKTASGNVDKAVKVYESLQKTKKKTEIDDYFASKKFELVPLEKLFDPKWLNKTKEMYEVRQELDAKITSIYRDIELLEKIPEHGVAAKAFYLEKLDIAEALRQVEALKANAEKLAREWVERDMRKGNEQVEANARAERQERREQRKDEIVSGMIDKAVGVPIGTTASQQREEILEYTMTFKGTKEQLIKLREYMTAIGVVYTKGLVLDNEEDARQIMRNRGIAGRVYSFIYTAA